MRLNRFNESRNPFLKKAVSKNSSPEVLDNDFIQRADTGAMTVDGAVNKSFILGAIMLMTAVFSYAFPSPLYFYGGMIGGLIVVIIASMKPHLSPTLAPLYAALEGLFVGGASAMFAALYDGIIFQAITLTMAVFFVMLAVYKSGLVKVTDKFRRGVLMAMGAIFLVYLANFIMSFFGASVPYLHEGGVIGIGISLIVIGVCSMMLLLDFDNFEKGAQTGAPKYMEWFFAMGLLITLVWLYIEILQLLAMFAGDE